MNRFEKALKILKKLGKKDFIYLGEGFSGIVFHNGIYVYKVHIPLVNGNYGESDGLYYLTEKINIFDDKSKFFYKLELFKQDGIYILKYPYEKNEPIGRISKDEFIDFLTECWKKKIIFKSITQEKNFIRVNGQLKFIDYEILPYSDNLFLNAAARAYLYIKHPGLSEKEYNRLKRSLINNFDLPEIEGFDEFLNELFFNIAFNNSKLEKKSITTNYSKLKKETFLWKSLLRGSYISSIQTKIWRDNYKLRTDIFFQEITLKPPKKKVSLVIKACPQDSHILYYQVKHIIYQLSCPDMFFERAIAIDKKEKDFLREYNSHGSLSELYSQIQRLIDDKLIDYYIELPNSEIEEINYRWFGIRTKKTHTNTRIPVTPQIYAFEKVKGDYILQMDSDVLIGREDYNHSFLEDMIKALVENENAISVGFNIPKDRNIDFIEYHAPLGGYKPEVRFALIHKERILNSLPWFNEIDGGGFKFGWYQALYIHQKKYGLRSLRGGDSRSFYIHPQNYRKTCKYIWAIIMDRIEKNIIPEIQLEKFDLDGSFYDWTFPKRNEKMVVLAIINKETEFINFLRFYESIVNQNFKDIGILVINTDPDYLKDRALWDFLKGFDNITYVHTKYEMTNMEAIYLAIHYFMANPDTFVILANPNDYFLGSFALEELKERLNIYNSDIILGKQITTRKIQDFGLGRVNFINHTNVDSNLYIYPKVFRKLLFDKISIYSLKKEMEIKRNYSNFEKLSKKYEWFEDLECIYLSSALTAVSENPIRFDFINYVIDSRAINKKSLEKSLGILRKKGGKVDVNKLENGRIDFQTNFNKIEIDITFDCNLKCIACNRSCSKAPSKEDYMCLEQIHRFIEESLKLGKKWELINILGGEPTLHQNFLEIVNLILNEYILKYSPKTVLQITSNGYSKETQKLLKLLPKSKNIVIDKGSFKTSNKIEYFTPFNLAPIDLENFKNKDFSKGCWVTSYCGMGLNKYGYYPCGPAGGMDRIMGYDVGIKSLKEISPKRLKELLVLFCQYCGNYVDYDINYGNFIPRCEKKQFIKNIISKSWMRIYNRYHKEKPRLSPIYVDEY
ncbi:MAG: radical SAM protein [Candidatus Helarchaeota archaeon]